MYGTEAGEGYIRLNLACPRERLIDGLLRLSKSLKSKNQNFLRPFR